MICEKKQKLIKLENSYKSIQNHPFSDFKKNKIVFGVGNLYSELLFLGEGPGAEEDKVGEPFVGRAGQLLTKIITAMGYTRDQVYITNVIKCRLPNNRAPLPEESEYDKKVILQEELNVIRPKVICCLGASALGAMIGYDQKISGVRGKFLKSSVVDSLVVPTYHPAYLLRNPSAKKFVWEDMQKILLFLKEGVI